MDGHLTVLGKLDAADFHEIVRELHRQAVVVRLSVEEREPAVHGDDRHDFSSGGKREDLLGEGIQFEAVGDDEKTHHLFRGRSLDLIASVAVFAALGKDRICECRVKLRFVDAVFCGHAAYERIELIGHRRAADLVLNGSRHDVFLLTG